MGDGGHCRDVADGQFVQLQNPDNGNALRLFADRMMIRGRNKTGFRRQVDGKWLMPTAPAAGPFGPTDYKIRVVYFVPSEGTNSQNNPAVERGLELLPRCQLSRSGIRLLRAAAWSDCRFKAELLRRLAGPFRGAKRSSTVHAVP